MADLGRASKIFLFFELSPLKYLVGTCFDRQISDKTGKMNFYYE
jgi:hypothetical protein